MRKRCERCNSKAHSLDSCPHNEKARYSEGELQAKLKPLHTLANNIINPEMYGFAVTAEVRDAARRALGMPEAEVIKPKSNQTLCNN